MSDTWSLICDETREKIWVGQGNVSMSIFYSGEKSTMRELAEFLDRNKWKNLRLVSDMLCEDHEDYKELRSGEYA